MGSRQDPCWPWGGWLSNGRHCQQPIDVKVAWSQLPCTVVCRKVAYGRDCLVSLGRRENRTRNIGKRMNICDLGDPCIRAQLDEHVPGELIINAIVSWNVLVEASIPMRVRVSKCPSATCFRVGRLVASSRSFSLGPSLQVSAAWSQACFLERAAGSFFFVRM